MEQWTAPVGAAGLWSQSAVWGICTDAGTGQQSGLDPRPERGRCGTGNTRFFRFTEFDPAAAESQRAASIEERLTRLEEIIHGTQSTHGRYESGAIPAETV